MELTGGILLAQLTTITLAAYAFARLRWPGRDLLFGLGLLAKSDSGADWPRA